VTTHHDHQPTETSTAARVALVLLLDLAVTALAVARIIR
jgi:hypothetical protein